MSKHNPKLNNLEPIVKLYQESHDERYLCHIDALYRNYIQGRAVNASHRFGLLEDDCNGELTEGLFVAIDTYNPELGVPFIKYANLKFRQALNKLYFVEKRDNHCWNPTADRIDLVEYHDPMFGKKSDKSSPLDESVIDTAYKELVKRPERNSKAIDLVYGMDNSDSFDTIDVAQDIANLIADEDAAERLMEAIQSSVGADVGQVVALTALGLTRVEVARMLDYKPECASIKSAQVNWVNRRLEKCIKPVERYYSMMGRKVPIKLR